MRTVIALCAFLSITAPLCCGAYSRVLLDQSVTVDDISANVQVFPSCCNDYAINVQFTSTSHGVNCLSAYLDLHYELRDSANHIVPIDSETLRHPPYELRAVSHVTKADAHKPATPCTPAPYTVWNGGAYLAKLYPHLTPGKYTLYLSFAPRGMQQHADFKPVSIAITPNPSPIRTVH